MHPLPRGGAASSHPLELNTLEGYRLLDDLATFDPALIVILIGGDPLMRRDLFDLIAHGIGLGLRMSLSPSVTKMVTYEVLLELRSLGLSRLSFSLDGSGAHVHDSFRGVRDSFDQTIARMQDALSVGLSLQINTTVSRHNLRDLPRTAEVLRSISGIVLWARTTGEALSKARCAGRRVSKRRGRRFIALRRMRGRVCVSFLTWEASTPAGFCQFLAATSDVPGTA